jgi:signal transduction histidine kinase
VIAGVAGGLGERLGIDPVVVRLAFVVLAAAGGAGLLLYVLLWAVTADSARASAPVRPDSLQKTVAAALVVLGSLLILRDLGLWFGDAIVWPVALGAFGSAIIWTRSGEAGRARWERILSRMPNLPRDTLASTTVSPGRLVLGGLLVAGGMAIFLAANDALAAARSVIAAVAVSLSGLALILGPWMWRLVRQLSEERRERIRVEERGEVAAHLHDSVLQTLALIQRAEDPREMSALAHRQERELRAWLYRPERPDERDLLSTAIDELADRIELAHRVRVEAIVVGDCPLDPTIRAVVDACGEALTNAARHSSAAQISVYVEVEEDAITAYVRDQGTGFDPADVPDDRRGIADSIRGRMERNGGTATIVTAPGRGTEVRLHVPRSEP